MAIAYDTFTAGGHNNGTTRTYSHTCTGDDRILFVHAYKNSDADTISGATYNGVAMTLIATGSNNSSRRHYLFVLAGAASGANNVVITSSISTQLGGTSTSYTGAASSGQPDDSDTLLTTATPVNMSVTTTADNCWSVLVTSGGVTASTNSVFRGDGNPYTDQQMYDNNEAITPAGSYTMTTTNPGVGDIHYIIASFSPVAVPSGPANLKTVNGLAIR